MTDNNDGHTELAPVDSAEELPGDAKAAEKPPVAADDQPEDVAEALEHEDSGYRKVTAQQARLLLDPVLIAVCGKPESRERFVNSSELERSSQDELYLLSMGAMIQNMLLAATALGLDSTWIARLARIPSVSRILKVPQDIELVAFVALGFTSQKLKASEGRRLEHEFSVPPVGSLRTHR